MVQIWADQIWTDQVWVDRVSAEPRGSECFAERHGSERHGSDGVAPASRPSNDPGHATRCERNQNADAPQSCSCRTAKLPVAWPPPTLHDRSPRHAWVAPS